MGALHAGPPCMRPCVLVGHTRPHNVWCTHAPTYASYRGCLHTPKRCFSYRRWPIENTTSMYVWMISGTSSCLPADIHRNLHTCMLPQLFSSCSHLLPMAARLAMAPSKPMHLRADTSSLSPSQQLKPLSVLLDVQNAPEACEHCRDVEEVVVHGVLPSAASLEGLVELCLLSLQNSGVAKRKRITCPWGQPSMAGLIYVYMH